MPCHMLSCPALTCHSLLWRVPFTLFCPLAMPSALLCPFLSSTLLCPFVVFFALPCPCNGHHPILCYVIHSALLFSRRTNRFAFTEPVVPARPALRFTLPLLYINLDSYLPLVPSSTQLCPYDVLILTPDLCLAPVCAALPSNISLLRHLHHILLYSLFRFPSRPALPSAMARPCAPFAILFLISDMPYLLPYFRLARRHVLIPVLSFAQPSANPSTM